MLEWLPPRDSGGREDVVFNIICKSCGGGRGGCTRCGDNVQFLPRQLGLTEPRVYISDLLAHTQYTFEVQAVNGVSDQSPYSPQYASVNITTNQAGKWLHLSFSTLHIPSVASSSSPVLYSCLSSSISISVVLCMYSASSSHSFLYKHIMHVHALPLSAFFCSPVRWGMQIQSSESKRRALLMMWQAECDGLLIFRLWPHHCVITATFSSTYLIVVLLKKWNHTVYTDWSKLLSKLKHITKCSAV